MKRAIAFSIATLFISLTGAQVRHYTVNDGLPTNEVRQVVELPNGQILVNCEGAFGLFDGRTFGEITCDYSRAYPLSQYKGYTHLWQGDSLLWLRDFYRLYLFDTRWRRFRYDIDGRLRTNEMLRQLASGYYTAERPDERWQQLADSIGANALVTQVINDRQGGTWLGTQSNGLYYIAPPRPQAELLRDNDIYRLKTQGMTDSQGRTWICSSNGLKCYNADGKLIETFTPKNTQGFIHSRMIFIKELGCGRYLLCNHAHYLGYFIPERHEFLPLNKRLPQLEKYRLLVGACPLNIQHPDEVVVYAQNGAFVLNTFENKIKPFGPDSVISRYINKYNCMLMSSDGHLWIGTQNGLFMANGNKVRHLSRADGLANVCIRSLIEDEQGNIWAGTAAGISRICNMWIDNSEYAITNFGIADGIPPISMHERSVCRLPDGKLVFAYKGGFIVFHPEWFAPKSKSLPICLTAMDICGSPFNLNTKKLTLPYNQNDITFTFSALNYATPERTRYRFRLNGVSQKWQHQVGTNGLATARYSTLSPGHYTFEVQCSIDNGMWSDPLILPVNIQPPLWLRWWAKCVYVLFAIVIATVFIHIYLKRHKAQLERENNNRVNHLFELREEARQQFAENVNVDSTKIAINIEEEKLVQNLLSSIGQHMDDADYTIEQLACDVGLSRSNLYRRMQTMLGITPNDFLRNVRLKHAARLLVDTDIPVNQIALSVGFQSPRYFSQYFKKMFGVTPSEYRAPKQA